MEELDFDFEAAYQKVQSGERSRELKRARIEQEVNDFMTALTAHKKELEIALTANRSYFSRHANYMKSSIPACHEKVLSMIAANPTLTRFMTVQTDYSYYNDKDNFTMDKIAEVPAKEFDLTSVDEKYSYSVNFSYDISNEVEQ